MSILFLPHLDNLQPLLVVSSVVLFCVPVIGHVMECGLQTTQWATSAASDRRRDVVQVLLAVGAL